jgi:hypothetical protein
VLLRFDPIVDHLVQQLDQAAPVGVQLVPLASRIVERLVKTATSRVV